MTDHVHKFHTSFLAKPDEQSLCDQCGVNFGSPIELAKHRVELKIAVVVLTRLQLKFET